MKKTYACSALVLLSLALTACAPITKRLTISPDRYVSHGHNPHINCTRSDVHCLKVKISDTWESLFPDVAQRHLVMALNRTNKEVQDFNKIMVPLQLSRVSFLDISPVPRVATKQEKHVLVDINQAAFGAYDHNGELIHWGPISAGINCNENAQCITRGGQFKIYWKRDGARCVSSKYPLPHGGGAMPWCMFFDGGIALHGGLLPGHHASEGCVRMFTEDAEWLYKEFIKIGTPVVVEI